MAHVAGNDRYVLVTPGPIGHDTAVEVVRAVAPSDSQIERSQATFAVIRFEEIESDRWCDRA